MAEARYYWLRLQEDFFKSLRIKKLRKLAGGDTFTIIYLKMQLMTLKTGGVLHYKGIEPTFAEELALDLDESPDNVDITIRYLLSCGLLETSDEREYFVPFAVANTGSEGSSAKRMRDARAKSVTLCEQSSEMCALSYGEKEIEKEKEKKKDKEIESNVPDKNVGNKPARHKYGEYNNVLLTDEELEKLKTEFPDWKERIERLSSYIAQSGKSYKSHLATIRNWARKDKESGSNAGVDQRSAENPASKVGIWL